MGDLTSHQLGLLGVEHLASFQHFYLEVEVEATIGRGSWGSEGWQVEHAGCDVGVLLDPTERRNRRVHGHADRSEVGA